MIFIKFKEMQFFGDVFITWVFLVMIYYLYVNMVMYLLLVCKYGDVFNNLYVNMVMYLLLASRLKTEPFKTLSTFFEIKLYLQPLEDNVYGW